MDRGQAVSPRPGDQVQPRKASLVVPPFEVSFAPARPRRASSERIRPAVLRSRRASSLAACKTSSSTSSVVLMHLMIKHQKLRRKDNFTTETQVNRKPPCQP